MKPETRVDNQRRTEKNPEQRGELTLWRRVPAVNHAARPGDAQVQIAVVLQQPNKGHRDNNVVLFVAVGNGLTVCSLLSAVCRASGMVRSGAWSLSCSSISSPESSRPGEPLETARPSSADDTVRASCSAS